MASDHVRRASKLLGPLLRRRGTSAALGTALRRALQALDRSLGGLSPQAVDEAVAAAVAELRACVGLIEQSSRPADHEQRDGVSQALALLAPPEVAPPAPPVLAVGEPERPSRNTGNRPRARPGNAPRTGRAGSMALGRDLDTTGAMLLGFAAQLELLQATLEGPLARLRDLDAASAGLHRHLDALRWLGRERAPAVLRVAESAGGVTDRWVAAAALVLLGEPGGGPMLLGGLATVAAAGQPLPSLAGILLRTVGRAGLMEWLLQVLLQPAHPTIVGLLLPLLAEGERLSREQLWELANHAKDDVAVPAALALPWTDGPPDLALLHAWAAAARTQRRRDALLFAAAALGSSAALDEARARLREADAIARTPLIDALVAAGTADDAALLTELATDGDGDPAYALLGAAQLGSADTVAALAGLSERAPSEVLAETRRMIDGRGPAAAGDAPGLESGVRYLRGQPWTVTGVLAALHAPDETLVAQRWMALELRTRTGQLPPSRLPALISADERAELLSSWAPHYGKAGGRLAPGKWYFQGREGGPRRAARSP